MKNQKGITLISLVMTIILVIILASVGTYTGFQAYENMRVEAFVAKMKTAQEAVNKFCEKYTVQEMNEMTDLLSGNSGSIPSDAVAVLNSVTKSHTGQTDSTKSWYSSSGDDIPGNYKYLSIEQLETKLGLKDFDTPIFFNPRTRNVIAVNGIKYDGEMYYRQYDLTGGQTLPEPAMDTEFNLSEKISVKTFDNKAVLRVSEDEELKELKYYKKTGIKDGSVVYSTEANYSPSRSEITFTESGVYKIEAITTANITKIAEGVEVVIVNKPMLATGLIPVKYNGSSWVETNQNDEDWYNYASNKKQWANAVVKSGSNVVGYYVWIPRFAYNASKVNASTGTIDIEFLKGTSSLISNSGDALKNSYKVHPAFQNGATSGCANGEWDAELTGIWVAKYQAIIGDSYAKTAGTDSQASVGQTFGNMQTYCKNVKTSVSNMNFSNVDTHLMKNSEWGAVAYLTFGTHNDLDIGYKAITRKGTNSTAMVVEYESTTTGNIYGVDDFVGGTYEAVAAGINVSAINSKNTSDKYVTLYANATSAIGDGINTDEITWTLSGVSKSFPSGTNYWLKRGGYYSDASTIHMFSYASSGNTADGNTGFRPVLIIEY